MANLLHAITETEKEIEARIVARKTAPGDTRMLLAAEIIADEMTRLRAEVRTLRYLYATAQAAPPGFRP